MCLAAGREIPGVGGVRARDLCPQGKNGADGTGGTGGTGWSWSKGLGDMWVLKRHSHHILCPPHDTTSHHDMTSNIFDIVNSCPRQSLRDNRRFLDSSPVSPEFGCAVGGINVPAEIVDLIVAHGVGHSEWDLQTLSCVRSICKSFRASYDRVCSSVITPVFLFNLSVSTAGSYVESVCVNTNSKGVHQCMEFEEAKRLLTCFWENGLVRGCGFRVIIGFMDNEHEAVAMEQYPPLEEILDRVVNFLKRYNVSPFLIATDFRGVSELFISDFQELRDVVHSSFPHDVYLNALVGYIREVTDTHALSDFTVDFIDGVVRSVIFDDDDE